ncbi:MAG: hypothetical protein RLZZ301_8 [Bacteroidota bacterium]|jgi:hypothetical protein
MKNYLLLFVLSLSGISLAQKNVFLQLKPMFGTQDFALNTTYIGNDGAAVELDYLNYYLSDIHILHDGGQDLYLSTDIFLIKADQYDVYLGFLPIQQIEALSFMVGVPKRYNTQAGSAAIDISLYPETHALSFQSPSMYWGWSGGYMHMVVGGNADSNNDGVPNSYFELHNLGNSNQRTVSMPVVASETGTQLDLALECHVDRWLNNIPLASAGILHDETGLNVSIMANVNSQNVFTQSAAAGLQLAKGFSHSVHVENGTFTLQYSELSQSQLFTITDAAGKLVHQSKLQQPSGSLHFGLSSGIYVLKIQGANATQTERIFIP